ncbi:MAG TPA: polynucleotide 5'-hydroxyl-kinase [Geomonas sp.]|nr:polynucleotide 5'-hydroxyl-kinase [Geomonas sp.]
MNTLPAPGWEELLRRITALRGSVLFLGRSDSGKSTLVRYLLQEVAAAGSAVALVDADVGQSFLGLPGSVSRRTFHQPPSHRDLHWEELSFLGAVSPARILSLLAAESARFVLRSRGDAAVTLVDTTGLVDGPIGRALKLAKIRAIEPELVVAVTAGDELEPILESLPEERIFRLAPSPLVEHRSAAVRFRYRHARLAAYFTGARDKLLSTRRLVFIHHGMPVHPLFAPPEPGLVVGLNHHGETRGLAVVKEADADSLVILTPLSSMSGLERVVLGDFTLSP